MVTVSNPRPNAANPSNGNGLDDSERVGRDLSMPIAKLTLFEVSPLKGALKVPAATCLIVGFLATLLGALELIPSTGWGVALLSVGAVGLVAVRRRPTAWLAIAPSGIDYFDGRSLRQLARDRIGGLTLGARDRSEIGVEFDDGSGNRDWSLLVVGPAGEVLLQLSGAEFHHPGRGREALRAALANPAWCGPVEATATGATGDATIAESVDVLQQATWNLRDRKQLVRTAGAVATAIGIKLFAIPAWDQYQHRRSVATMAEAAAREWQRHSHVVGLDAERPAGSGRLVLTLRIGDQLRVDGALAKVEVLLTSHENSVLATDSSVAVDLAPGPHTIRLVEQGGADVVTQIQVVAGAVAQVDAALAGEAPSPTATGGQRASPN